MTTPSFADLAAKLTASDGATAPPNLDSSMMFAPDDRTDHPARLAEARALAAAKAAAVVSARESIDDAFRRLGEGVEPGWYDIEGDAWGLADEVAADIERHRAEALAEADEADPEREDPDARVAVDVAHDLALTFHALLVRLREREPSLDGDELRELVDEAQTVEGAERAAARSAARFEVAEELRRRIDAYGKALYDYLAGWPEEERDDEAERVRELVFGE